MDGLETVIKEAEGKASGFLEYTLRLLWTEAEHRHHNEVKRRRKAARLPRNCDLNAYDHTFGNGLSSQRMAQLRSSIGWTSDLTSCWWAPKGWVKQCCWIIYWPVDNGYKAYFRTMEELVNLLKWKITRTAMADYKRLLKANLIIIDDIMLFPVKRSRL